MNSLLMSNAYLVFLQTQSQIIKIPTIGNKKHTMTLIKSISGIRGTIGGTQGTNLTPIDAVQFAAAYGTWLKNDRTKDVYLSLIHI